MSSLNYKPYYNINLINKILIWNIIQHLSHSIKPLFFINSFVKTNYYLASSIRENIAQTVLENDQHNGGQSIQT